MYVNAITKSLAELPLDVASRINEKLITGGIIFREWDDVEKQAELRYALEPLEAVKNVDRSDRWKPNNSETSLLRNLYTLLDVAGVKYYPEKGKPEQVAESLADFILTLNGNPLIPFNVEGFRKLRFWEKLQGAYKR